MRLQELMNSKVESISPRATAEEAIMKMRLKKIRHLVVMDGVTVQGVISERDLGGKRGSEKLRMESVAALMSPQVVTAKPDTSVRQAANLMRGRGIGCLPILDGRKLKGIVTAADLLEVLGRGVDKPTARTERAILSRKHGKQRRPVR